MLPPERVDVAVCVAVYRDHGPPNLATLSGSLEAALDGLRFEVVVALNGIDAERAGVPDGATVVDLGVNRGVPVAWNAAARAATARHLVFANDDLELGPGSLAMLSRALDERPDVGVVGPVGTQWDIADGRHVAHLPDEAVAPGTRRECDVLSGFLFATPASVFEAVGGFDEALTPCSYEEVDYCTSVRLRLGKSCVEVAGVDARHEFQISAASRWHRVHFDGRSERVGSIARRNRRHFVHKWRDEARAAGT
jgi:GT2 family glycosyltransferase